MKLKSNILIYMLILENNNILGQVYLNGTIFI